MEITIEQKMYSQIVQKAWSDAEFKKDLIENPVDVIERLGYRIDLPQGQTVVVNDQTEGSVTYITIPKKTRFRFSGVDR